MRCCVSNSRACIQWSVMLFTVIALASACAEKGFKATSGCSGAPVSVSKSVPAAPRTYQETGIASWYGKEFHGKKTASGEIFDMFGISAAHRTLPLGTIVRVTNLDNLKNIQVKVNDRGPFIANRVLELSYEAARQLAFLAQGTARVQIETPEQPAENVLYTVQAGVFTEEENARLLKDRLSKKFQFIVIVPFESNLTRFYRVRVGTYGTEEKAEQVAAKLKLEGVEPYVMRKD
jgi:rare lipoprotein A